jgi:hypothetical protein
MRSRSNGRGGADGDARVDDVIHRANVVLAAAFAQWLCGDEVQRRAPARRVTST